MEEKPRYSLAIYGSHDANICIKTGHDQYRIYELERLTKERNFRLNNYSDFKSIVTHVRDLIKIDYGIESYGSCFYAQLGSEQVKIMEEVFGFNHFEEMNHHIGHAACGLYQSDFNEECLIFSYDSGGHELDTGTIGTFCVFTGDKRKGINKIADIPLDVCSPYTFLAIPISEIRKEDATTKFLSYAGKIMGLAAYGKVREEWVEHFEWFYYGICGLERLVRLGEKIGLNFYGINKIKGQDSCDIAATSQYVFEKIVFSIIQPFTYTKGVPVILTGGGALNVLMNQQFKNKMPCPVFVPCNPNDCGLSFGFMALRNPPEKKVNIMYNGVGITDFHEIKGIISSDRYITTIPKNLSKEIARLICKGKIVGIMRGNSEVGARALGNRSILCLPDKGMKDKINIIKNREFFRPFAPVCKEEDVNKYFEFSGTSEFMSYAPIVREEYRENISAIVHADNTARVQTINKKDNEFLYELIDCVDTISGTGVVLNTSLNIKGRPICTTVKDALEILDTTDVDFMLINEYLFSKKK